MRERIESGIGYRSRERTIVWGNFGDVGLEEIFRSSSFRDLEIL